jgi:exosortase A-associated hydrolase 2
LPSLPLPEPFYLPMRRGRRFCVRYRADRDVRGALLFVHAFAEEMNKSRRMAALASRALADRGFDVLQVDLYGCGDSDGEFGDADWAEWRDDVVEGARWWHAQTGHAPILWSMRAGCLIACEAASIMGAGQFLFWQPQPAGAQALQQFLRLRVAQQALVSTPNSRTKTQDLREALARGESIEVAGYLLSPGVALGLEAASLSLPASASRVAWMEIVPDANTTARPVAQTRVAAWRSEGLDATLHAIEGPEFWQTQEIAESRALIDATVRIVDGWCS